MEIQWKNVFLFFGILLLLIYLGSIVNTFAEIITGGIETIKAALPSPGSFGHGVSSRTYSLARLCALLIFIVGVLKLIKNWSKK